MIGRTIAHYSITGKLGEGGMGEVYLATDTKLNRQVALKILPEQFAADGQRMTRFEREAQVLASLNHPNIGSIHGIEDAGATKALVLELIEGPTLADRIEQGPIASDEALQIALQIAEALDAAHAKGITHRDLKPANIKLTPDGQVKVLDFGLARVADTNTDASSPDLSLSPTLTMQATQAGVIMGTAAYMAPEQARGKPVDKRADIWAFGVVFYQMLTGRAPFRGEDFSEILAAVLATSPDYTRLPDSIPSSVDQVIRRCLERDPKVRFRDIGDVRYELLNAPFDDDQVETSSQKTAFASRPALMLIALLVIAAVVFAALALSPPGSGSSLSGAKHASIALPPGHALVAGPDITRDGERIAFISTDGIERPRIYTRRLDEDKLRPLAGTEEAYQFFFSPDGRWIAFYASGQLFKVNVTGGSPVELATAASANGGTWLDNGTIIFTQAWNSGFFRIAENGGQPEPLLIPDRETTYAYVWPHILPGSQKMLFSRWGETFAVSQLDLSDMSQTDVLPSEWRRSTFVEPGYIITTGAGGDLLAVPADPLVEQGATLEPVLSLVDNGQNSGYSRFSISSNGTLVYSPMDLTRKSLVFVDQEGRTTPASGESRNYETLNISPDGRRVVYTSRFDLFVQDLQRGSRIPVAHEIDGAHDRAIWNADGTRIIFGSNHGGDWDLYSMNASGVGELEVVVQKKYDQYPESVSPDGTLIYRESNPETGEDLWFLPPGEEPRPWLATAAEESQAAVSPDGRLVAFVSNASGREEVYVQALEGSGDRIAISATGGGSPLWLASGTTLYYRSNNHLMMSEVTTTPVLAGGEPTELFDGGWNLSPLRDDGRITYAPMADGRLLMVYHHTEAIPTRINVVFNWFAELEARVPRD